MCSHWRCGWCGGLGASEFGGTVLAIVFDGFAVLGNGIGMGSAIAQEAGKAWLYHGWDPVGNSLGMDPLRGDEGEEVQTESLDNLLEENSIDRVDVIKVDVEGAEELVLRGATRTLNTYSPVVIFEFNPGCAARLGLSPGGARDFLQGLGYEFVVLGDCANCKNPAQRPTYFNIIAIPKQLAGEFSRSFHSLPGQPQIPRRKEL